MTSIARFIVGGALLLVTCAFGCGGTGAGTDPSPSDATTGPDAISAGNETAIVPETVEDTAMPGDMQPADTAVQDTAASLDVPVEKEGGEDNPVAPDTADTADAPTEEAREDVAQEPTGELAIGSPCTAESSCPAGGSGTPLCQTDWPGGYCLVKGCAAHGHDCPGDAGLGGSEGSKCVKAPDLVCLALCDSAADCREGYDCVSKPDAAGHGSVKVCFPK